MKSQRLWVTVQSRYAKFAGLKPSAMIGLAAPHQVRETGVNCKEQMMAPFLCYFPVSRGWWTLENARTLAEICAYAAALVFFIYKALAGYLVTDLRLKVECKRTHTDDPTTDRLSISATAKKGQKGLLKLHDAQARVSVVGTVPQILELTGIERLTFCKDTDKWPGKTRRKIVWQTATKNPFLNLAPGDEGQFSCACEITRSLAATVEVVILGRRLLSCKRGQWRSSVVSLPIHP
jgi:hypothetical protein